MLSLITENKISLATMGSQEFITRIFSSLIPKNLRHRLGCDYQMDSQWMHRLKFVLFALKQGN